MLSSGNDAAVALAIYCGGTVEGFAERMNDKARVPEPASRPMRTISLSLPPSSDQLVILPV